jgi:DNA-binding MarR family transcriptional regulator
MEPTQQLGYLIHHLAFVMDRQSDQVLQERLGIGFSQFKILMILKWHENVRQKFIADYLGQTEASISRQLRLMQKSGLVSRLIDPKNRRQHIVCLTHRGQRLLDESMTILNQFHAPLFTAIGDKNLSKLNDLLASLHNKTCSGNKTGRCFQDRLAGTSQILT